MRWRREIARCAGLPPLDLMEGFYEGMGKFSTSGMDDGVKALLPIKWECLKPTPLTILLMHSDYDGDIQSKDCAPIADELEKLLPLLPDSKDPGHIGYWRDCTQQFIDGLRLAAARNENVDFH